MEKYLISASLISCMIAFQNCSVRGVAVAKNISANASSNDEQKRDRDTTSDNRNFNRTLSNETNEELLTEVSRVGRISDKAIDRLPADNGNVSSNASGNNLGATTGPTLLQGTLPPATVTINFNKTAFFSLRNSINHLSNTNGIVTINQGEVLAIKVDFTDPEVNPVFNSPHFMYLAYWRLQSPEALADLNASLVNNTYLASLIAQRDAAGRIVEQQSAILRANACTSTSTTSVCTTARSALITAQARRDSLQRQVHAITLAFTTRTYGNHPVTGLEPVTYEFVDENNNLPIGQCLYLDAVEGRARFDYRDLSQPSQSWIQDCVDVRRNKVWYLKIRLNHCEYSYQRIVNGELEVGNSRDGVCQKKIEVWRDLLYR